MGRLLMSMRTGKGGRAFERAKGGALACGEGGKRSGDAEASVDRCFEFTAGSGRAEQVHHELSIFRFGEGVC
jgi:hypothetical protein